MSTTTAPPSLFDGPFLFIEGLAPEAGNIFPAPPVPQFVVAHTSAGHCEVHAVDPRFNGRSADGIDYTDFTAAKRAATVLNAAKDVFDWAPVPHHYDRTCPHPRVIKDHALKVYGIDATDAEITAATKVVMA